FSVFTILWKDLMSMIYLIMVANLLQSPNIFAIAFMRDAYKTLGSRHSFPPRNLEDLPKDPSSEKFREEHYKEWLKWWNKGSDTQRKNFFMHMRDMNETIKIAMQQQQTPSDYYRNGADSNDGDNLQDNGLNSDFDSKSHVDRWNNYIRYNKMGLKIERVKI
ncbi:MAG: hypothetical protein JW984_11965, partial [Deltaproteobacteria bacterium]|nr:hypothetical protein [Candidatus Zymogenus saltonus]